MLLSGAKISTQLPKLEKLEASSLIVDVPTVHVIASVTVFSMRDIGPPRDMEIMPR